MHPAAAPVTWAKVKSVNVLVTVQNNGAALGIGSSSSVCNTTVTVNQVPLPPALSNTAFFVPEMLPVGTWVGNVGGVDPANFTVGNYTWSAVDSVSRPRSYEGRVGEAATAPASPATLLRVCSPTPSPSTASPATSPSRPISTRSCCSRTRGRCDGRGEGSGGGSIMSSEPLPHSPACDGRGEGSGGASIMSSEP